ncbi:hypothetical protein [uncultured Dubosiella sp.]|uniref:hypothetical protein n=1 Tax=uncultured Dubosiella sp. TaxID=1937011 RepID=UPI00272E262D|nr:hypothetical protein [uncultured Dubosiella sp.]
MKGYGKEAIVKIGVNYYQWSYVWGILDAVDCLAIDDGGDRSPQEYVDAYADYIAEKYNGNFGEICAVELQPLEKTRVDYAGGCSRSGNYAVDYMRVEIAGIELYAEIPVPDDDTPEKESKRYDELVDEIDHEAFKKGVPSELLYYWYD